MASLGLVLGVVSAVWAFIGIVCPIFVHFFMWRSPNKGIVQVCLILSAVCCYLFWISTYLCQLNPIIGPQLDTHLIRLIQMEWPKEVA